MLRRQGSVTLEVGLMAGTFESVASSDRELLDGIGLLFLGTRTTAAS